MLQLEDMLQQFENRATDVDNTDTCVNLNEIGETSVLPLYKADILC